MPGSAHLPWFSLCLTVSDLRVQRRMGGVMGGESKDHDVSTPCANTRRPFNIVPRAPGSKKWVCPAQPLLQSGWPSTALLPTSSREHRRRCGEQLTAFMSTPAPDPCSRTGNLPSSPRLMCSNVFPQPGLCSPRGFQSPYGAFHWRTLFRGIKGWQFLFV